MIGIEISVDAEGHVVIKKPQQTVEMMPNEAREEANHYVGQMRAELVEAASTADRLYEERDPYT